MRLAKRVGGVIVSVDSMQVYRRMDIGTAKPTADDQAQVDHYMIDVVEPSESFSSADFQRIGRGVLDELGDRPVIVAGGSGLHFRSLLDPMTFSPSDPQVRADVVAMGTEAARNELLTIDPSAGDHLDLANPRRVQRAVEILRVTGDTPTERSKRPEATALRAYEPFIPFVGFGVDPGDRLEPLVSQRLQAMLSDGFVDEVASVRSDLGVTAAGATGYREVIDYLDDKASHGEMVERIRRSTMGLAKRQRTFFRRDPRIDWLEWDDDPEVRFATLVERLDRLDA